MRLDKNNPGISEHQRIGGYTVKRVLELKEIRSIFYELEHTNTGAKHVHISNQDRENTFSVAFKTVPADSTGIAHILEHTVLCGSVRYPVRDPFFSMLKRSLSTFMNAFTAPDWTMYPFSTQNRKDFYNLMDVYLDAVFFPKIDRLSFSQEGCRIEIGEKPAQGDADTLVYKGVVYNEMKGAMSSPDHVLERALMSELYPATTYRFNSGGDPSVIPSLTYQQLVSFHRLHYHPSNSFFYTYGNLSLKDHLSFIEEKILSRFDPIDPQTQVPSQPRWRKPQAATHYYSLGKDENPLKKAQVAVAWLTAEIRDTFEVLSLILLEHILLGHAASPLRKALIDSGLGSSLCDGSGYTPDYRDTLFVCGLKDVKPDDAERIEAVVFDTLSRLVDEGIDGRLIESAIHQIEFHRKEITNQPYPYGIKLLLIFSGSWFHGADPVRLFQFDTDLALIRQKIGQEAFFENQIRKHFLDNPHRVRVALLPDQSMEEKEREKVSQELHRVRAGLSASQIEQIRMDAEALKRLQETEQDVSCLPTLTLEDIPSEIEAVTEHAVQDDICLTSYLQPTGDIFYLSIAAGTGLVAERLVPLVPFFCHGFSRTGTTSYDYTEIAQRIAQFTGGFALSANSRTGFEEPGPCIPFVLLNGKCLVRNLENMFDLIEELVYRFDFSDLNRLRTLLLEYRAAMEGNVVHNGHRLALSLASRNFSAANALNESWHGIHQLQMIKRLTDDLTEERLAALATDLSTVGRTLFCRKNIKTAIIGEEPALTPAASRVQSLIRGIEEGAGCGFLWPGRSDGGKAPREGWSTATAVSFVACTFETAAMAHEDSPCLAVIGKLIRSLYLHREIREKGGAYGGLAVYNPEDGLFGMASYRDPHIVSTLDVYQKAMTFIRTGNYADDDIKEAILQVCADIDKPDPPGPSAKKAFYRKILSIPDEARQKFKTRLLSLTRGPILRAAEKYFAQDPARIAVAVISSRDKLQEANQQFADQPLEVFGI